MTKRVEGLLTSVATCVLPLSLSALAIASQLIGGQLLQSPQGRSAEQHQAARQTNAQPKQTFEGKIIRPVGKLPLEDKAKRVSHQLDDQQLAELFEGKDVKLTGTLDPKSHTIHISDVGPSNRKHTSTTTTPQKHKRPTHIEYGVASWYQRDNQGPWTASGEPFDEQALTAAHPRLPFGTRVMVTNLSNGRSVVVRINDRGPFTPGRLIDLSKGAAERLRFTRKGLAAVRTSVLSTPSREPAS